MNKRILILAALLVLVVTNFAYARIVEVFPSQVAVISPAEGDSDLTLGPRVCLKFNLPEEVGGVEIGYADLVIRLDLPAMTDDSLALFEAFGLTSDWSENVGWNDFASPGGDVDSAYYSSSTYRCGIDSTVSLDITNLAQGWNTSEEVNYGLIIIPRTTDFTSFREFDYSAEQIRNLISLKILIPGDEE